MAGKNSTIANSLVILKQGDGATPIEVFTAVAAAQNVSGWLGNAKIDATGGNSIPGPVDYKLKMQGVLHNAAALGALMNAATAGTVRNYQIQVVDKFTITGPATISDFEFDGRTCLCEAVISSAGFARVQTEPQPDHHC